MAGHADWPEDGKDIRKYPLPLESTDTTSHKQLQHFPASYQPSFKYY
jgi:hypothetical protein